MEDMLLRHLTIVSASVLVILGVSSVATARGETGKHKGGAGHHAKRGPARGAVISPDRRHVARVTSKGLWIDGRRVAVGMILRHVVWRRDGRALAFLRRTRHGALRLIIIPDVAGFLVSRPTLPRYVRGVSWRRDDDRLVWRVPAIAGRRPHLFWMGRQAVGLGPRALTPRVVVRWTTQLAQR